MLVVATGSQPQVNTAARVTVKSVRDDGVQLTVVWWQSREVVIGPAVEGGTIWVARDQQGFHAVTIPRTSLPARFEKQAGSY